MTVISNRLTRSMLLAGLLAGSIVSAATKPQAGQKVARGGDREAHPSLPQQFQRKGPSPRTLTLIRRLWGIEVLGVQLTSGGYMTEFRFRVLDPEKAKQLFDRQKKPYLLDKASGAKFLVPAPEKIGELRNVNRPEAGKIYWMVFGNPGKFVKKGNVVTVVAGDFRLDGLSVN